MHRRFTGSLPRLHVLFNDLIDLIPQIFSDNGRTINPAPFAFRLGFGAPGVDLALGIKRIHTFSAGFFQNSQNRGVTPDVSLASAVASGVQADGNLAFAPTLQKQFIGLAADGRFFRLEDQIAVFPLVAVGGKAVDGFTKLGAGQHRRIDPFGDFLAFPLGKYAE